MIATFLGGSLDGKEIRVSDTTSQYVVPILPPADWSATSMDVRTITYHTRNLNKHTVLVEPKFLAWLQKNGITK